MFDAARNDVIITFLQRGGLATNGEVELALQHHTCLFVRMGVHGHHRVRGDPDPAHHDLLAPHCPQNHARRKLSSVPFTSIVGVSQLVPPDITFVLLDYGRPTGMT